MMTQQPAGQYTAGAPSTTVSAMTPREITAYIAAIASLILLTVGIMLPLPYVISSPGPTFNTLGDLGDQPVISSDEMTLHRSEAELRFTTASIMGAPGSSVYLPHVLGAWFSNQRIVRPFEWFYAPNQSQEDYREEGTIAMVSSQETAQFIALDYLGYEVSMRLLVLEAVPDGASAGILEPEDVLLVVAGEEMQSYGHLVEVLEKIPGGSTIELEVERDGEILNTSVVSTEHPDGGSQLGIYLLPEFEIPVDLQINIDESIGGPSAGLIFTLALIESLTAEELLTDQVVAGTGTIELDGSVGAIGGIVQKMHGSKSDGAQWFLAPQDNCDEVVGRVPSGLQVAAVSDISEAVNALELIGAGRGAELPTCQ